MSLASRGLRDMDDGPEAVEEALRGVQAEQVRRIRRGALLGAAVFTAAVVLAPV